MNKILICSHGKLSDGFLNSLKIIMGDIKNIDSLTFYEENLGVSDLDKLDDYFSQNIEDNLIVLTDVYGGSVNQEVIKKTISHTNIRIISGINFPLLLELAVRLDTDISDDDLKQIIEQSKNQMIYVENNLEKEFKDDFDF